MKAIIPHAPGKITTKQHDTIKRKRYLGAMIAVDTKRKMRLVDARFFTSHAGDGAIHCLFAFSSDKSFGGGVGVAAGYGYCKRSAALNDALREAGITLDKEIAGVGDNAMREALEAIAEALGVKKRDVMVITV